jgi:hypothetical protein
MGKIFTLSLTHITFHKYVIQKVIWVEGSTCIHFLVILTKRVLLLRIFVYATDIIIQFCHTDIKILF